MPSLHPCRRSSTENECLGNKMVSTSFEDEVASETHVQPRRAILSVGSGNLFISGETAGEYLGTSKKH